jgi:opacity protein-like surface antigen
MRERFRYSRQSLTILIFVLVLLVAGTAGAEWAVGLYGGKTTTQDSDVDLVQPGGTNLSFGDVSWDDESFESPIYYGIRTTYWTDRSPNLGIGLDLYHIKMIYDRSQTVTVTGTRNGTPVSDSEPLGNTFDNLQFSHGLNIVTLNGLYRWFPNGGRDDSFMGRIQPYAGVGLGIAVSHVEVATTGTNTEEYQYTGPAFQGDVGVNFDILKNLSAFTGYKLSYTNIDADLNGGGSLETDSWTHHFTIGMSYNF